MLAAIIDCSLAHYLAPLMRRTPQILNQRLSAPASAPVFSPVLATILSAALLLTGCTTHETPPPVETNDHATEMPAASISVDRIIFRLQRRERVAEYHWAIDCSPPYDDVLWGDVRRGLDIEVMRDEASRVLADQGYTVTGNPDHLFRQDEERRSTDYLLRLRLDNADGRLCRQNAWLPGSEDRVSGSVNVDVHWALIDRAARREVASGDQKGYSTGRYEARFAESILIEDALADAVERIGAGQIRTIMAARNPVPEPDVSRANRRPEDFEQGGVNQRVAIAEAPISEAVIAGSTGTPARPSLRLDAQPLLSGRFADALPRILNALVLVEEAESHGTGVFVAHHMFTGGVFSGDMFTGDGPTHGWLLNTEHVVSDTVRIGLPGQRFLTGQVLRRDPTREIALIEVRMNGGVPAPLPIRTTPPEIGEVVYAVGAPKTRDQQATVSQGIVSARLDRQPLGSVIEADLTINPGSSGSALVDAHGNLIGIAVAGSIDGPGSFFGASYFVPIQDALEALDIELAGWLERPS